MTIAWIFPGQGSQKLGMGKDVISLKFAKERFDYASNIFAKNLYTVCEDAASQSNIEFDLNNTKNTQICLFLVESILIDSLKGNGFIPNFVSGHSLGEISALYSAQVLSFEDCVKLIKIRSELMAKAKEGGMAALIGFNRDDLNLIIDKRDDIVIANDNSSSQVVLSGSNFALESISKEIKCKRFIKLNVSGAFHSPFMKEPSKKFSEYLDQINFQEPLFPIISNSEPSFSKNNYELKLRLKKQMCNGVRWRETMDLMNKENNLHIVEVGPSNILGGLVKRHLKGVKISNVSSAESLFY